MSSDWDRVSDIFDRALACRPGDRDAFVAAACGGDAALLSEVIALLAAHDRSGGFLEEPAARAASDVRAVVAGRHVGPYRIEKVLGEGGMGIVFLAVDSRLDRKVALKALSPDLSADARRRERLRREARAAASLSHPNVATVFALEEFDGQLYIASEYVPGSTLREAAAGGPLEPDDLVSVARQVARALSAAHAQGIVHRDLKPENLVRREDGVVKVLDFGIARTQAPRRDSDRLTEAGGIVGTPAYMSPEQIEGREVDGRSDLFSLGIVMFELATGRNPFAAPTPIATAARVIAGTPPALTALNPRMPAALEHVVGRCLQKAPAQRYPEAAELVRDLEAIGDGMPLPAAAPPVQVYGRTWWTIHQLAVMGAYAALVYPVWRAKLWVPGWWTLALLLSMIAAAAFNGTLRAHLLFTAQFNPAALALELRRAGPFVAGADWLVALILLATAVGIAGAHTAAAVTLAAFGAGSAVASGIIEPATTRAAFPPQDLSSAAPTPAAGAPSWNP